MSDKEIYELDVVIDNRDIDKTEKKLKTLDKLLQQTQRRATVLGKTKIAPKVTLDDRLSSKATFIKDNLMKLDRMRVTSVATFIDHVSSNVGAIRSSLASLTQTRWSVAVDGVAWDTVIGKSFDDWMGSEGQSTLEKISSAIGTALGNGLRGFIMQALGLVEAEEEVKYTRVVDYLEKGSNSLDDESPYAEAGRLAGESFFQSFLGALDPEQIASKLSGVKCSDCEESSNPFNNKMGIVEHPDWTKFAYNFFTNYLEQLPQNMVEDIAKTTIENGLDKYKKYILDQDNPVISKFFNKPSIDKELKVMEKGTKVLKKTPFLNLVTGTNDIITAESGRERSEAIGGLISSLIVDAVGFTVGGPAATLVVDTLLGVAAQTVGEKAGAYVFDMIYDRENLPKTPPLVYSDRVMAPSVQGVVKPEQSSYKVMGTPIPEGTFTEEEMKALNSGKTSLRELLNPNINVTIPEGAVNMTINKDENIDYDELTKLVGFHIKNAVQYAEQNLKNK